MSRYASTTTVNVDKSKREIEGLLRGSEEQKDVA